MELTLRAGEAGRCAPGGVRSSGSARGTRRRPSVLQDDRVDGAHRAALRAANNDRRNPLSAARSEAMGGPKRACEEGVRRSRPDHAGGRAEPLREPCGKSYSSGGCVVDRSPRQPTNRASGAHEGRLGEEEK